MADRRTMGTQVLSELAGDAAGSWLTELAEGNGFGAPVARMALEFAFADVWGREERLTRRERSLIVISALAALRASSELRAHIGIGLTNGLSADEIEEILVQLIPYAGFPSVMNAFGLAKEVLSEKSA